MHKTIAFFSSLLPAFVLDKMIDARQRQTNIIFALDFSLSQNS